MKSWILLHGVFFFSATLAQSSPFSNLCGSEPGDPVCQTKETLDIVDPDTLALAQFLASDSTLVQGLGIDGKAQLYAVHTMSSKCGTPTWLLTSVFPPRGDEDKIGRAQAVIERNVNGGFSMPDPVTSSIGKKADLNNFRDIQATLTPVPKEIFALINVALNAGEDIQDYLDHSPAKKLRAARVEFLEPEDLQACGGLRAQRITFASGASNDSKVDEQMLTLRQIDGPGGIVASIHRNETFVTDGVSKQTIRFQLPPRDNSSGAPSTDRNTTTGSTTVESTTATEVLTDAPMKTGHGGCHAGTPVSFSLSLLLASLGFLNRSRRSLFQQD